MKAPRLNEVLDVVSSVALILATGVVLWVVFFRQPGLAATPPQVEDVEGLHLSPQRIRNVLGQGSVTLIEISDFQCPFCSKYVTETFSAIRREFIDPGVVRYVAMHFPLERIHARAFAAAEAAECAATQGRYWQMHARLFSQPAALQEADFANHAQELELDHVRFDQCLRDDHSVEIVRADLKEAEELGVAGTPTFFLGFAAVDGRVELVKRINGAAPLDVFVRELRALLSR